MDAESRIRELSARALALLSESYVTEREYGARFAKEWRALFDRAIERGNTYSPAGSTAMLTVNHSFAGVDMVFHFDQAKMASWFAQEVGNRVKRVFVPQKLRRSAAGVLTFHESVCVYDPDEPESALSDEDKNIMACALPCLPPALRIVYGNKWVDSRFGIFTSRSLQLFLIRTDYVPAFLGSDMEICLYLFLMDYCIIRENYKKVADGELCKFLHVFRPSPMLQIKELAEAQGK